jgi:hypothetical protein
LTVNAPASLSLSELFGSDNVFNRISHKNSELTLVERRLLWRAPMTRVIWLGLLALSACGDPNVSFQDVGPDNGGNAAGGTGAAAAAGDSTAGMPGGTSHGGNTYNGHSIASGGSASSGGGIATGGTTATAGSEASGGTDINAAGSDAAAAGETNGGAPPTMPDNPFDLVDDMERAFPNLPVRGGRDGAWFSAHDDTYGHVSGPSPISLVPARGSSHVAAGLSGGGFTGWGAQLGVSLKSSFDSYDASGYCGVHFWAKGSGAGWSLLISDHSSMPQGGVCDLYDFGGHNECYRFVGKGFSVSANWQELTVGFDELRLMADPSSQRRLETAQIYTILFNFYGHGVDAFDLQVDDLSFIEAGSARCP